MSLTASIKLHLSSVRFLATESIADEEKTIFQARDLYWLGMLADRAQDDIRIESGKPAWTGIGAAGTGVIGLKLVPGN